MASVSRDKMKAEALRRLRELAVNEDVLRAFEEGMLYASRDGGAPTPISDDLRRKVEQTEAGNRFTIDLNDGDALFEEDEPPEGSGPENGEETEEYSILIYHIIENRTPFGPMAAMLYVSSDRDEWRTDFSPLKEGGYLTYAYVESPMEDGCGSVVVAASHNGGVVRKG